MKKYMLKNLIKQILLTSIILVSTLSMSSCKKNEEPISKSGTYFDTVITITLYDPNQEDVIDGCFKLAQKYEDYFSTTNPESDIAKINSANGNPVNVHSDTIDIIKKGIYYSSLTDGKFDITVGKLSKLWQNAIKTSTVPADSDIKEALSTVNYRGININGNNVNLTIPDQELDLGGIAKGYIADKMKAYILKQGVKSGIINLGGNVVVLGHKPDGSDYNVGIQKPFSETGEVITSISVNDESMVTSGTYERYFKKNGTVYHHILDLSTGYPCNNNLNSVTILSKKSVDGDALSTSCFCLGEEQSRILLKKIGNIDAVFVDKNGNITKTNNK
jgi:thiamine biosynthesis lipoprotein